jgi:hypothetical protein
MYWQYLPTTLFCAIRRVVCMVIKVQILKPLETLKSLKPLKQ